MNSKPIVRKVQEVVEQPMPRGRGAKIRILLGPDDRMPNYYTREIVIEPGGSIPLHRHPNLEHQQLVLDGEMTLIHGGGERTVRKGEVIYLPPNFAHAYANRRHEKLRFLCIVPATDEYQTEWLDD